MSHNQFKDYNVGPNGVILNNGNGAMVNTQLGGIIVGNPNLKGGAANVILNEVNGGSPSQLRGYTEVAGQSAKVIVANPYGVTCSGCGFINTPTSPSPPANRCSTPAVNCSAMKWMAAR